MAEMKLFEFCQRIIELARKNSVIQIYKADWNPIECGESNSYCEDFDIYIAGPYDFLCTALEYWNYGHRFIAEEFNDDDNLTLYMFKECPKYNNGTGVKQ